MYSTQIFHNPSPSRKNNTVVKGKNRMHFFRKKSQSFVWSKVAALDAVLPGVNILSLDAKTEKNSENSPKVKKKSRKLTKSQKYSPLSIAVVSF